MEYTSDTIISLSGIYAQPSVRESMTGEYIDLTALEGTTFFCEDEAADTIRQAISSRPLSGIHWIDSGDYHYVSLFWLERIKEPFVLLMMDHHSDMQESAFGAGLLSCGSWLLQSLRTLPMLQKVILIGPEDGEVLEAERCFQDKVLWVRECELKNAAEQIRETLKTYPVYISFDKDILSETYCTSGWTQGEMKPEMAMELIRLAHRQSKVIGIDICGEAPPKDGGFDETAMLRNLELNRYFLHKIKGLKEGDTLDEGGIA